MEFLILVYAVYWTVIYFSAESCLAFFLFAMDNLFESLYFSHSPCQMEFDGSVG